MTPLWSNRKNLTHVRYHLAKNNDLGNNLSNFRRSVKSEQERNYEIHSSRNTQQMTESI